MTTLIELVGPYPVLLPERVGFAGEVTYSLGENNRLSDCTFVALANLHDLVTAANGHPEVMSDGEIEHMYSVEAGFDPNNKATDKGAVLETILERWTADGWPGDDALRPLGYCDVRPDEIPVAIWLLGGVCAWCMLPPDGNGGYDFEGTNAPGEYAHAVFICDATWNTLTLVSWARKYVVPRDWWDTYGKQAFGVLHPQRVIPRAAVTA